ncbi:MAG: hypothetical protein ABI878_02030, partial [Acidobacteriota bacterium]
LDEKRTEQINLGINDTLINDVSLDGSRILFDQAREESDLWQVGIETKSEKQVTSDPELELWPDISSDGKSIVFQKATESKHLLEGLIVLRSIGDDQQINIATNGFSPKFSPDGQEVAFLRDSENRIGLWVTGRNGGDERALRTDGFSFNGYSLVPYNRVQANDYSWTPDGSGLIYCAKKDGLWNIWQVAATGASEPNQVSKNNDEDVRFSNPIFSPDGKRISYVSNYVTRTSDTKTTANACLLSCEHPEILFSSKSEFKLLGWDQTGNNLLIALPENRATAKPFQIQLILVSPENRSTDLALIDAAYFYNVQLSPDRRWIAFVTHVEGNDKIMIVSSADGEEATIANTAPNMYVSGLSWSPDSKTIYYGRQKQQRTISMIENFK